MSDPDVPSSEHDPTVAASPVEPTRAMPTPVGPGGGTPPAGGSRRWWWIVGGVLAVMVVVIAAALLLRDGDDGTAASETTTTPPTEATATTAPAAATTAPTTTTAPAAGPSIESFSGPATAGCPPGDETSTQQVQLSWSVANADDVTIGIDGPGPFDTYPSSGSAALPFTCPGPHTYHLVATGPGGQATEVLSISGS